MDRRGRRDDARFERKLSLSVATSRPRRLSHRVERRRAQFRSIGFRCIGPFGRRGKEPPDRAVTFPSPPIKFRTVVFPQYGFKLDWSATTLHRQLPPPAYTWPIALHRTPVALRSPAGYSVRPDQTAMNALTASSSPSIAAENKLAAGLSQANFLAANAEPPPEAVVFCPSLLPAL